MKAEESFWLNVRARKLEFISKTFCTTHRLEGKADRSVGCEKSR